MNYRIYVCEPLRWFIDFNTQDGKDILYEKFFHCWDLGRDLVPIVKDFHASEEKKTNVPGKNILSNADRKRIFNVDETTEVPDPFNLMEWIENNEDLLCKNPHLDLFNTDQSHPDKEFSVLISKNCEENEITIDYEPWKGDTWVYQIEGNCLVTLNDNDRTNSQQLFKGWSGVVPPNTHFTISREKGSIGMIVRNNPEGNKV